MPTYQPTLPSFVETATYYQHQSDDMEAAAEARSVPEDEIEHLGNQALQSVLERQLLQTRLGHGIISFPFVTDDGTVSHVVSVPRARRWHHEPADQPVPHIEDEPFEIFREYSEPKSRLASFVGKILRLGRE